MDASWWASAVTQLTCSALLVLQAWWVLPGKLHLTRRVVFVATPLLPITGLAFGFPVISFIINLAVASLLLFLAYRWYEPDSAILEIAQINRSLLNLGLIVQATALPFAAVFLSLAGIFSLPWSLVAPAVILPFFCVIGVIGVYDAVDAASSYLADLRRDYSDRHRALTKEIFETGIEADRLKADKAALIAQLEELRKIQQSAGEKCSETIFALEETCRSLTAQLEELKRQSDLERRAAAKEMGRLWYWDSPMKRREEERKVLDHLKTYHADRKWLPVSILIEDMGASSLGTVVGAIDQLELHRYVSAKESGDDPAWTNRWFLKLTKEGLMSESNAKGAGPTINVHGGNVQYIHEAGELVQQLNLSSAQKADDLQRALVGLMNEIDTLTSRQSGDGAQKQLANLKDDLSPKKATDIVKLKGTLEKVTLVSKIIGRAAAPVYAAVEVVQKILGL